MLLCVPWSSLATTLVARVRWVGLETQSFGLAHRTLLELCFSLLHSEVVKNQTGFNAGFDLRRLTRLTLALLRDNAYASEYVQVLSVRSSTHLSCTMHQ